MRPHGNKDLPPRPRNPEWLRQTAEEKERQRQHFACQRGEHLYETGRTICRLCGEDL